MNIIPYLAEIFGAFLFVCLSIPIKTVKLPHIYKAFITVFVIFVSSYLFITYKNRETNGEKIDLQKNIYKRSSVVTSLIYTLFTLGIVVSFEMLPVSIALPITMSAVIFTLLFNKYLNNVNPSKYEMMSIPIIVVGIIMIVYKKEKFEKKYMIGIVFGILAAVGIAYVFSAIKKELPKNINNAIFKTNIELFEFTYITTIILAILAVGYSIYYKYIPDIKQMLKMALFVFIFQYIGYQFYYYAYNVLDTDTFVIIGNIEIPFSLLLGYLLFGENITLKKLAGSILIIGGVLLGLIKKTPSQLSNQS